MPILSDIIKGIDDFLKDKYVILTKEDYENLLKEKESTETKNIYREITIGVPDLFDDPNDIEQSNTPVYYIPVGDGLYRPTYSKATFLENACTVLYDHAMFNESFGSQFKFLIDHGFLPYDLCLAIKEKEKNMLFMIGKTNDELPHFVRSAWLRCFGPNCDWSPLKKEKDKIVDTITKNGIKELKKAFGVDENKVPGHHRLTADPNQFNYPPFIHHVTREYTDDPVDFTKYPNVLIIYTKVQSGRGKPLPSININALGKFIKQYGPKDKLPFTTTEAMKQWMHTIPLSFSGFWKSFGYPGYTTYTRISSKACDRVNTQLGIEFIAPTKTKK
jgi:hypothetical protein